MEFWCEMGNDRGGKPEVINVGQETLCNGDFRKAIWTGKHLQITVMSIPVGGEIGIEMHKDVDQIIKIESGYADVYFGKSKECLHFEKKANDKYMIIIPAGTWHNIVNAGCMPLKVYSMYAPPQHPAGTVHKTKFDSDVAED